MHYKRVIHVGIHDIVNDEGFTMFYREISNTISYSMKENSVLPYIVSYTGQEYDYPIFALLLFQLLAYGRLKTKKLSKF